MATRREFLRAATLSSLAVVVDAACGSQAPAASPKPGPAAGSGAPGGQAAPAVTGPASTVSLGTIKGGIIYMSLITAASPYHVAVAKKYFDDEGLRVEALEIQTPADAIQALGSDLQFATPSVNPTVNAYNQGNTDLRIIAPIFQGCAEYFCVKSDSPIRELRDVKGTKVAITFAGGSAHALAQDMVKEAGLAETDVEYVPISGGLAGINAALLTGQVQVAPIVDPNLSKQLKSGEIRILWDPTSKPGFKYNEGVMVSHAGVIQRDPELLKATVRAWHRAMEFIHENPKEAGELWGPKVNAPADIAADALGRLKDVLSMKTDWETYGAVSNHMASFGQLQPSGKMPWQGLFGDQSMLPPELQTPMPANLPNA
jgi:NitT/TauT family transport system substrate-binding protein